MSEALNQPLQPYTAALTRIRQNMADLAERTVRGLPPFDQLPQYLPLNANQEFLTHYTDRDKLELVESYVAFIKFAVAGEMFRNEPAWRKVEQLGKEQGAVLRARYVPASPYKGLELRAFPMKERKALVQPMVAKRFPDFRLDRNVKMGVGTRRINAIIGNLIYSKPLPNNNRLLMSFDLGSGKTDGMFDAYIGVEYPLYTVRASNFFVGRYGRFYYNPEELGALMSDCLDILEVLMPEFEQKVIVALDVQTPTDQLHNSPLHPDAPSVRR